MSPDEMKNAANAVKKLLTVDAVKITGIEAKKHFQEGFQPDKQGFTDERLEKWAPLKPATIKRKARKNGSVPPILTDKGHLRDSIEWAGDYDKQQVTMSSDRPYAEVHNEGGGPKNMPKRQFMGPSKALENKIVDKIERQLDKIFGR